MGGKDLGYEGDDDEIFEYIFLSYDLDRCLFLFPIYLFPPSLAPYGWIVNQFFDSFFLQRYLFKSRSTYQRRPQKLGYSLKTQT